MKIRTLKDPITYINAIVGTIDPAKLAILFIPPIITSPTRIVMTKEDIIGFKPKLEFNVLDMLSIWGILPEPKVETKRQKEKTTPSHFIFRPFSI